MRESQRFTIATVVALCAFVLYLVTLAPTVGFVDSGALTVAAWGLGVAHPPGFPLYTLITHLFTLLPLRSVAWRSNLASAFFAAIACGAVCLAAAEILLGRGVTKSQRVTFLSASAFAGLMLMSSRTLWRYATLTEVYALNTALITLVLWLVFWWRREARASLLFLAAICAGLALGVHHLTVVLTLAALMVLLPRRPALISCVGVTVLVAALIYAYLPWAASRDPVLNWGDPDNWTRFVRHITAEQYRSYVSAQPATQLREVTSLLWFDVLLAAAGLFQAWRSDRTLLLFFVVLSVLPILWLAIYPISHDQDAYLLPSIVALTLAAAYGVYGMAKRSAVVALALLAIPIFGTVVKWQDRDRSNFDLPRQYVADAVGGMKENALLFTSNWQLYSPLFYFLEVERMRRDVKAVEYGMLIRSWYLDSLTRRYPELMHGVQSELDSYRSLLTFFENDKKRWNNDPELQQRLNERLDELVLAMMRKQRESGGHVYASPDVAMSIDPIDRNLVRRLRLEYQIVPAGLVLEFVPRGYPIETVTTPLKIPDVSNMPQDEVVLNEVIPSYRTALELRK